MFLALLMIGARYAPLERAGELPLPSAQIPGTQVPSTQVPRGDVSGTRNATDLATGSVTSTRSANSPKIIEVFDARTRMAVDAILAGAQQQQRPEGKTGASPGQHSGKPRTFQRRDDSGSEEIYIGGTGLLHEDVSKRPPHPIAAANPDSFVVICEAGCRPDSDRIVYKVSKTSASAAAIAKRRLEVTSAETLVASADNAAVCIAGCYDDEPARKRQARNGNDPSTRQLTGLAAAPAARSVEPEEDVLGGEVYRVIANVDARPQPRIFHRLAGEHVAVALAAVEAPRALSERQTPDAVSQADVAQDALAARHLISQETHMRAIRKRVAALTALSRRLDKTTGALCQEAITPLNRRAHWLALQAAVARYAATQGKSLQVLAQLDPR